MRRSIFALVTLSAFASLAGCGKALAPLGTPAAPSQALAPAASGARAPGALLYISDTVSNSVYVYSYPQGKLKTTLYDFTDPAGECVDASGDVFVANTGAFNILEYAHGGATPIATLKDPDWFPVGCSVNPVTGDLAVTDFPVSSGGRGDVAIYPHAKGHPHRYSDAAFADMLLCGYDGSGNLFVDGLTSGSAFAFAELRAGSKKLTDVTLDQSIGSAGGVEWDGKYVAVGDQSTSTIYEFSVSGKTGKMVGSTVLGGASQVFQFWIDGSKVIGPDSGLGDAGIWSYPAGGSPVKTITGLYAPLGAVVSR